MKFRDRPIVVYANMILALVMIWSFINGMLFRLDFHMWQRELKEVRSGYDFIGLFAILLTIIVIIGLFRLKEWGRQLALSWNCIILVVIFITRIIAAIYYYIILKYWDFKEIAKLFTLESILVAVACITLIIGLTRKSTTSAFKKAQPVDVHITPA